MLLQQLSPEQTAQLGKVENLNLRKRLGIYYRLPQDLQDLMFSEEVANIIGVLEKKYGLVGSGIKIAKVIGFVVLGEIPIKDFIRRLMDELQIDQQKAGAIAQDINQQIFQPVRASLMAVHGLAKTSRPAATGDQQPTQAPNTNYQVLTPTTNPPPPPPPALPAPLASPAPLTLEELEKREAEGYRAVPLKPEPSDQANRSRQELIERLKKAREEQRLNQPPRTVALKDETPKPTNPNSEPKGTTTAWNGRTIDLRKVPPRRSSPNGRGIVELAGDDGSPQKRLAGNDKLEIHEV